MQISIAKKIEQNEQEHMNLISIQISRKLLKIFALLETLFDGEVENTNSHFSKNNLHRSMVQMGRNSKN